MSSNPGSPTARVGGRWRTNQLVLRVVAGIAGGILLWSLPGAIRFFAHAPSAFWAMAVAAVIVDIPLFGISGRQDMRVRSTLSVCFTFAIFVIWGAAPAIVVQAVAGAVTVTGQRYHPRAGVYLVSRLLCAAFVAEFVVDTAEPRPVTLPGTGLNGGDLLAFLALGAAWFAVSYGLLALARWSIRPGWLRQATGELRMELASTATAVLVVSPLLTTIPGWWVLLVAAPLLVWNQLSREQLQHEERLDREPASGLLNPQGLDSGLRSITGLDLVTPGGPRPFGIILINVEALPTITRTLGRDVYEAVVALASRRLVETYGSDRVARLWGEGMAILIPDLTDADAVDRAGAAVELLSRQVEVDDIPFALDPVAGVALSPKHGRDLGTLS